MNYDGDKNRIYWVDIVKIIGIFMIYLGHMGASAGMAYNFVFQFHVALFFFVSGCMETGNKRKFVENFKNKCIHILMPFFLFFIMAILCRVVTSASFENVSDCVREMLRGGIRNHFGVGSLWFLTGLFTVEIFFSVIKKLKNNIAIVLICTGCYLVTQTLFSNNPIVTPSWVYNVDSALYYIIFYALGYVLFPYICDFYNNKQYKIIRMVLTVLLLCYSVLSFMQINLLSYILEGYLLGNWIYGILHPMVLILTVCCIAFYLQEMKLLRKMGSVTLYFCGSEYVVKRLLGKYVIENCELQWFYNSQIATYLYVILLLLIVYYFFVPIERWILTKIKSQFISKQNQCNIRTDTLIDTLYE